MARPRYGYKRLNGEIVPDEQEQGILNLMSELRASGKSYRQIAAILKEKDIKTRHGKYWSFQRIDIVCNQAYIQPSICFMPNDTTKKYLSRFTKGGINRLINNLVENEAEKKIR